MQLKHRITGLALITAVTGLVGAQGAAAQAPAASWTCRGSAVELQLAGNERVKPIVAERTPCSDGIVGVPNLGQAVGLAQALTARTAYGVVSATPPGGFPKDQKVAAQAGVEGLELKLLGGALTIGVDAAISEARGSCAAGVPGLTATSRVVGLRINGQEVVLDGPLSSVVDPISNSPLGALVQVKLNEETKDAAGITRRAVHVVVLDAAGATGLADVVIAESRVSSASACDPNAPGNSSPTTGSGAGSGDDAFPLVCPKGSELDRDRGVCLITAANSGGQGVIVVGVPFSGPSGGTVISLVNARKRFKSSCLNGPGPRFAVIGTNRGDRITGTNRPDRILGLRGNDVIDGGRGDDCLDGGTGADNLAGGNGKDRILGMTGGDALNGGPDTDRLTGGSGDDSINTAFGQDKVTSGSGNDFVNAATAGKPASVDCGTGKDKVRVNGNERSRTKACEVRYVFSGNG